MAAPITKQREPTVQRSVALTAELDAALVQRAELEDRSASSIVRQALRREFQRDREAER